MKTIFLAVMLLVTTTSYARTFRAGAFVMDVTPTSFPVIVNGYTFERTVQRATDRLAARALVLDDGAHRVAIVVVDSCVLPRSLLDLAKELAQKATGIPANRMLISATHTHSAPSTMPALGSREDSNYSAFLPGRIAEAIVRAQQNMVPAKIGWTVTSAPELTHCRLWIMQPGRVPKTPFDEPGKRILMCPPYAGKENIGPAGPVDADVTLLSVQSPGGRPIALLANYGMHFYGAGVEPLSADWCGEFCEQIQARIAPNQQEPRFVAIMSQGTSGDQHWMDFSRPAAKGDHKSYAAALVKIACEAYQKIRYHDWVPLAMEERLLELAVRKVPETRLAWAKPIAEKLGDRLPRTREEVYAREQILLSKTPATRELKLQALRIGELGITAIPCEVYGITGLRLKAESPLQPTMNIELANGEEGYIPPPEQHALGGYSTWEARTSCLETTAEPKIVEAVLGLLENISGKSRRKVAPPQSAYAQAVLAAKPLAYWRLEEWGGATALDATSARRHATYEPGIARRLDGPPCGNCCPHFAGGRLSASLKELKNTYTIELWLWDAMPGTGSLIEFDDKPVSLKSVPRKTWQHFVLIRDGERIVAHLNGNPAPDVLTGAPPAGPKRITFAAGFEGKLDEIAVYARALSPEEIQRHYQCAGHAAMNPK